MYVIILLESNEFSLQHWMSKDFTADGSEVKYEIKVQSLELSRFLN